MTLTGQCLCGAACFRAEVAFDDQARWKMTSQIFTDEKPGHYDFANRTRMMTGPEVFEAFARGDLEE